MEAIPKSDIKSDIRFGNRFDIRIKQTAWIKSYKQQPPYFLPHFLYIITFINLYST